MGHGHLELKIEELLKEKASVKIPFVRNWIFQDRILIDIAGMNSRGWMQI